MLKIIVNKKKTFVKKIKEILQNIKDWFNSYLDKVSSKSPEAKVIREATDRIDGQIELWDAMLKSSIETNQALQNEGITGEELAKNVTNKTANIGDVRYAIREEYAREIDEWIKENKPEGETFILGSTGDILQGLGAIESDIYMLGDKIKTILSEHSEITIDEIKKIPQILENPVLILKSRNIGRNANKNSRLVIYGTIKATNGNPMLAVLDLKPVEKNLLIEDMQKITSAYTKDNNPVDFVKQSEIIYADKNIKKPLGCLSQ